MKKFLSVLLSIAMLCTVCIAFGTTASAAGEFSIESVTVAGNGTGNWLNGVTWDAENTDNNMTEIQPGVWQILYTDVDAADDYQFMICVNGSFGDAFTSEGVLNGSYSPTYTVPENGATVRITADLTQVDFDSRTGEATVSFEVNPDLTPAANVTITVADGSKSNNVIGTYQSGSSSDDVYSVDVSWGSLEFTYTDASEGTWNPETHTYDGTTAAAWSCETDANKITVTNHSNVAVDAALAYTAEAAYSSVSGSFTEISGTMNDNKLELASADGTTVDNAPVAAARLTLSGTLADGVSAVKIGSVTITVSDHESGIEQDMD